MEVGEQASADPRPRVGTVATAGALGLAVALLAVGAALRLDQPVSSGPRDPAPIQAGRAQAQAATADAPAGSLPPLALVLDRRGAQSDRAGSTDAQRVETLRRRSRAGNPAILVQLGAAEQRAGDLTGAIRTFERALAQQPGRVDAQIGLALARGAQTGDLDGADRAIAAIASRAPTSQVAAFNRGWLALYRDDPETARAEWRRTVRLGATTPLGVNARTFLGLLQSGASRGSP